MEHYQNKKVIGILGGMGPQASCELYRLINTRAEGGAGIISNKDFPHLIINNLPVPDLINSPEGKDITVGMVRARASMLERAGSTDIFMACNTMHLFEKEICAGIRSAQFHSMIDIVAQESRRAKKVLILGTRTTIEMGLYQNALKKMGVSFVTPREDLLTKTVNIILNTIAGVLEERELEQYLIDLKSFLSGYPGIDTIILGCTELPLVFPKDFGRYRVISSLDAMADYIYKIHQQTLIDKAAYDDLQTVQA